MFVMCERKKTISTTTTPKCCGLCAGTTGACRSCQTNVNHMIIERKVFAHPIDFQTDFSAIKFFVENPSHFYARLPFQQINWGAR